MESLTNYILYPLKPICKKKKTKTNNINTPINKDNTIDVSKKFSWRQQRYKLNNLDIQCKCTIISFKDARSLLRLG